MNSNHVTLTISEAFREGNISPDFLPPIILKSRSNGEIKFVLSEKEDCYYTVTKDTCSCDQFISGMRPCPHQIRGWVGDVRKLAKQEDERLKIIEKYSKIHERKREEERLKIEEPERYLKIQEEKRLKREEEERLKKVQWLMREQERKEEEKIDQGKREQEKREQDAWLKKRQETHFKKVQWLMREQEKREQERRLEREQDARKWEEHLKREGQEYLLRESNLTLDERDRVHEEHLQKEFQERLEEIKRNTKTDQTSSPKKKARFYNNTLKKVEKPITNMINSVEEERDYYRDLYG